MCRRIDDEMRGFIIDGEIVQCKMWSEQLSRANNFRERTNNVILVNERQENKRVNFCVKFKS